MHNFEAISKEEQIKFVKSFTGVFCDLDGVIWRSYMPISGASECLVSLNALGKKIQFITNNATRSAETLISCLGAMGYKSATTENLFNPTAAIINYLKEINYSKHLYVMGSSIMKKELENAGFFVVPDPLSKVKDMDEFIQNIKDDENIGAVVYEFDVNLTQLKLQKALTYLKREDCLFLCGSGDEIVPFGQTGQIMWNHHFQELITHFSERNPHQLAKPSTDFKKQLFEKFSITDPSKYLYIGDSIQEDMVFATKCGFQKLLVLTGVTNKKDLQYWQHPPELKPEYYIQDLQTFNNILSTIQLS